MSGRKIQEFFGDDLEDTVGSLLSVPGAFGNILWGTVRQMRLVDGIGLALVFGGWVWLILGYGVAGNHHTGLAVLAILPTLLWLLAGFIGGLFFEIGGVGYRSLIFWESYLLLILFAIMGLMTLRLALNPRARRVYRAPKAPDA